MIPLADIQAAARRIGPYIHRTAVFTSAFFDRQTGGRVFFKCENFQKTGSFKIRGAAAAVLDLPDDQARRGVVTHSSGNHGAALAQAAGWRGIAATVVCPENTAPVKVQAMQHYGARLVFCRPTLQDRQQTCRRLIDQTGACLVHPYNDRHVIAGQATCAAELLEQAGPLDLVLVPVGGGGLASGTALAVRHLAPDTRVIGVEPAGADDAARSLQAGRLIAPHCPRTIADGLRTGLGELTFDILRRHLHRIVTVSEPAIVQAMRLVWQRMKIIIEPSAAVPVAALLEKRIDPAGRRLGVILSGGNVDLDHCPLLAR